jgi:hypothetical protein
MRRFWLFRSELTSLEYYHEFKDLETFKNNCHDYYLLLPVWLLENDYFDEVTIWRMTTKDKEIDDIIFDVNGKKYIQKWVTNFNKVFSYPKPEISFFRGGFQVYDRVTKPKPQHFGLKLYLGAGRRITPQWGGIYDVLLMEDERDFIEGKNCQPFYKTASPYIFHPFPENNIEWDICWPCNFTQIRFKGQAEFIKMMSQRSALREYKIVHCGNKPEVGRQLCKQFKIDNIEFRGPVDRPELNRILNSSKFGLNLSNLLDGCPRVSTEVLMSGTPLLVKDSVRLLSFFKSKGVIEINNANIVSRLVRSVRSYDAIKADTLNAIKDGISFDNVNKKNIDLWKTL